MHYGGSTAHMSSLVMRNQFKLLFVNETYMDNVTPMPYFSYNMTLATFIMFVDTFPIYINGINVSVKNWTTLVEAEDAILSEDPQM